MQIGKICTGAFIVASKIVEFLAILWAGYVIYLATRKPEQHQNHLMLVWLLMSAGIAGSLAYHLLK